MSADIPSFQEAPSGWTWRRMDAEKMNLGQAALLQQSLWWAPPWPALMGVHALQERGVSPGIDQIIQGMSCLSAIASICESVISKTKELFGIGFGD